MRARNEARRERFLNARQRAIGIDVDALNAQCEERASAKAADAVEDAEHASRQAYVAQLVEQREQQEKATKLAEMQSLKSERTALGRRGAVGGQGAGEIEDATMAEGGRRRTVVPELVPAIRSAE